MSHLWAFLFNKCWCCNVPLTSIGFTKFLGFLSLIFSFLQMLMLQLKMRHLKKIRETDEGQIKEQDVPLTWDSPQIWSEAMTINNYHDFFKNQLVVWRENSTRNSPDKLLSCSWYGFTRDFEFYFEFLKQSEFLSFFNTYFYFVTLWPIRKNQVLILGIQAL